MLTDCLRNINKTTKSKTVLGTNLRKKIMKMTTLKSVAIAVGLASSAFGQATSPIVGYTTTTIDDEFGVGSPKTTLVAPTFVNKAEFSGDVGAVSGAVVTLDGAAFTAGEFDQLPANATIPVQPAYYIESADGFWANIISNDGTSVTLAAADAAQLTSDDSVVIRKHVTISQFFGSDNSAGLNAAAFDPSAADNIILLAGGSTFIFYPDNSGSFTDTYLDTSFSGADNVAIQPDQGLQVVRRAGGATSLVFAGALDDNARQVTISTGVGVLPVVLPTDTTLGDLSSLAGSLNGVDGLVPVGADFDTSAADSIQVLIDGSTTTFFANNTGLPGTFIDAAFGNQDSFEIPNGAAIVVNRAGASFTWTIPAPL